VTRELSAIELPLRFTLHQHRAAYAIAREEENWRGRIDLLDLDIEGMPQLDDTLSLIRSTIMTRGRSLKSVTVIDLRHGSIGPLGIGDKATTAESRILTVTAEPTYTFRELFYESNLARLQRCVIDAAKAWRATPPAWHTTPPDNLSPWGAALAKIEQAVDDLVRWERLP
jgi:hypothetical protein